MDAEAWKGPPPRPSFLSIVGEWVRSVFSWRFGIGLSAPLILGLVFLAATTPVPVQRNDKAKVTRARGDIKHIADQVKLFRMDQNRWPDAMADLVTRPSHAKYWPGGGYLEKLPKDPWGGDYMLVIPSNNPQDFDVVSFGADNAQGGDEFDADLHSRENLP
ncbi:MAG: type II secretion system protein GspG [Planctomycetota bacterium]